MICAVTLAYEKEMPDIVVIDTSKLNSTSDMDNEVHTAIIKADSDKSESATVSKDAVKNFNKNSLVKKFPCLIDKAIVLFVE